MVVVEMMVHGTAVASRGVRRNIAEKFLRPGFKFLMRVAAARGSSSWGAALVAWLVVATTMDPVSPAAV